MAEFTWTSTSNNGARWTGSFPSYHNNPHDNLLDGNYSRITSYESLLNNGRATYYVDGDYFVDLEYKNYQLVDSSTATYDAQQLTYTKDGTTKAISLIEGYFVETASIRGYVSKVTYTYPTKGTTLTIKGRYNATNFVDKTLRSYYYT